LITNCVVALSVALLPITASAGDPFSLDALLDDTASPEPIREPSALWPKSSIIDPSDQTVTIRWTDQPDETLPFAAILQIEHARAWDDSPDELFAMLSDGRRILLHQGAGVTTKVALMKVWLATKIVEMPVGEGHVKAPDGATTPPTLSLATAGGAMTMGRIAASAAPKTEASVGSSDSACTDCMSKRDVDMIVKTRMDKIRGCYQRELRNNPGLSGHLVVKFVVGRDGGTANAVVKESGIQNKAVEQCVLEQFLLMKFPRPPGNKDITASYPLMFAAG